MWVFVITFYVHFLVAYLVEKKIFDTLVFNSLKRKLFLMRKKKSGDTKDFFITIVKRLTSFFFSSPSSPISSCRQYRNSFSKRWRKKLFNLFFSVFDTKPLRV